MKTYLECIPCFFKQALEAARMAGADEGTQKKVLDELAGLIPKLPLDASPPEIGREIYKLVAEISDNNDPFKQIKEHSNRSALALYPKLKALVDGSPDRLLAAVELAIAGNIIDYGAKNSLNIEAEIKALFTQETEIIKKESRAIFDYQQFKRALQGALTVLYLADNAGEVVFDRVLIEELVRDGKKSVIYVVKDAPAINDALSEDAVACGIDKYARIVSSGSDAPGTVLRFCSPEFLKLYEKADMVISKGQGNYEALSGQSRPIFFLFRVKCPVIARDIRGDLGDIVLKSNI